MHFNKFLKLPFFKRKNNNLEENIFEEILDYK